MPNRSSSFGGAFSCQKTGHNNNDKMLCKRLSVSAKGNSSGPKSYVFWTLVGVLCVLAWANMMLTIVIFRVLHLGHGLECMELMPELGIVKFYGESFFGKLEKSDGKIKSFSNAPFEVKGIKGPVVFEIEDTKGRVRNSLRIDHNGTHVKGMKEFTVGDVFSTESPKFELPHHSRNIETKITTTSRITSSIEEKLILKSDSFAKISGSEGATVEGKEILWTADQEIHLKSINGSIILSGKEGISIDVKSIPVVLSPLGLPLSTQFKVCVCMPEGKLFRVPVSRDFSSHVACHNIDISSMYNPCM